MRAILIPVKSFAAAKTRLADSFSPEARRSLAEALCADFFRVVAEVRGADRIFVVSKEPQALEGARLHGWDCIPEREQTSESLSVDMASRLCAERGVTALLRLPADMPLARPEDIGEIFAQLEPAPSVVIVPSREGTGTNALLRSPPCLFPSHFGPGSFALHMAEAENCGASVRVIRNPRLALDIDDMSDLEALSGQLTQEGATAAWLRRHVASAKQVELARAQ
jgi:2-phospho-L-lactate guanylyltransferase